jgi:hypothetical protein
MIDDAWFTFSMGMAFTFAYYGIRYFTKTMDCLQEAKTALVSKNDLRRASLQSVDQATKQKGPRHVLVKGRTVRGKTLHDASLRNSQVLKRVFAMHTSEVEKRPLFLKNYFRSQFLWSEYLIDQEIQSEVFYLVAEDGQSIRVCPNNTLLVGNLTHHKKTGRVDSFLARAFLCLTSLYTTESQCFYENDEVSVFGVLKYNTLTDEYRIDNPLAFLQSTDKDGVLGQFTSQFYQAFKNGFKYLVYGAAFSMLTLQCLKMAQNRYNTIKEQLRRKALIWEDQRNKIDGAPPLTRTLDGLSEEQTVYVDSYACIACKESPATILFQPCLHLCLCVVCYKAK